MTFCVAEFFNVVGTQEWNVSRTGKFDHPEDTVFCFCSFTTNAARNLSQTCGIRGRCVNLDAAVGELSCQHLDESLRETIMFVVVRPTIRWNVKVIAVSTHNCQTRTNFLGQEPSEDRVGCRKSGI